MISAVKDVVILGGGVCVGDGRSVGIGVSVTSFSSFIEPIKAMGQSYSQE